MNIYEISRNSYRDRVGWDAYSTHIIAAFTEDEARKLASEKAADEGKEVWLNPIKTSIEPIGIYTGKETTPFIICSDGVFHP